MKINDILNYTDETKHPEYLVLADGNLFLDDLQIIAVIIKLANIFQIIDLRDI